MADMRRVAVVVLLFAACSSAPLPAPQSPELPTIAAPEFRAHLANLKQPAIVNVWASWCLPCRAEAPLLREAHTQFGDRITFIGIDYNDSQAGARRFIDEFGLPFVSYFDPAGDLLIDFGGFGVPRTYFFASGGELLKTHTGALDEQTLAIQIDELLRR
jgi:cytochrome c biogenesis protein CcmG/thiol:disulfide interchange protein DsbE